MTTLNTLKENYGADAVLSTLSAWELTFLSDITKRQSKDSFTPTPKQTAMIEKLSQKVSGAYVEPEKMVVSKLGSVVTMMHTALLSVQYPKITFNLKDGGKLELTVAGSKSNNQGQINLTDGGPFGSNKYYGRITLAGVWEAPHSTSDEIIDLIIALGLDSKAAVKAYGQHSGKCCFCNSKLTTKASLFNGWGPVCADKYGLPWGEVKSEDAEQAELDAQQAASELHVAGGV